MAEEQAAKAEGQEPTKTNLDSLPEDIQQMIKDLRQESAKYRTASKAVDPKLQEELDALKKYKADAEEADLQKKGEYEKIIQSYKEKEKSYKSLEAKIAEYEARDAKELETELAKLPKEMQEAFKGSPLSAIKQAVALNEKLKGGYSPGSQNGGTSQQTKDISEMSEAELILFQETNPAAYQAALNKYYSENRKI